MKYPIKNRWNGSVIFEAEINCSDDTPERIKLGLAVRVAVKAGANLARANLAGANLADANLADANLAGAYLAGANLAGVDLSGVYLSGANLSDADLSGANLSDADLSGANMAGVDLARANMVGAVGLGNLFWFGPIGKNNRTGYAYEKENTVYVRLGCRDDVADQVITAVLDKYGEGDYLDCVKFAVKIVQGRMEKK